MSRDLNSLLNITDQTESLDHLRRYAIPPVMTAHARNQLLEQFDPLRQGPTLVHRWPTAERRFVPYFASSHAPAKPPFNAEEIATLFPSNEDCTRDSIDDTWASSDSESASPAIDLDQPLPMDIGMKKTEYDADSMPPGVGRGRRLDPTPMEQSGRTRRDTDRGGATQIRRPKISDQWRNVTGNLEAILSTTTEPALQFLGKSTMKDEFASMNRLPQSQPHQTPVPTPRPPQPISGYGRGRSNSGSVFIGKIKPG